MCQAYRQQYGLNALYLLPVNLYGPRDNFDLHSSHRDSRLDSQMPGRHAIAATKWSMPGARVQPAGNFSMPRTAPEGLVRAMEKYDSPEPVNLGSGREITIRDLTHLVAKLSGFKGEVVWDPTKPDGQPRRCLDTSQGVETVWLCRGDTVGRWLENDDRMVRTSRQGRSKMSRKEGLIAS